MFAFRSTTLIEDTDLLVFLLYYADASNSNALYFRSEKVKSYVYNIKVIKQVLGEEVCKDLLFLRACPYSMRLGVQGMRDWKKMGFQQIIEK